MVRLQAEDGAFRIDGLRNSARDEACLAKQGVDGWRCVPDTDVTSSAVFSDQACGTPAAPKPPCSKAKTLRQNKTATTCAVSSSYFEVGAPVEKPHYGTTEGGCEPFVGSPKGYVAAGAPLTESAFPMLVTAVRPGTGTLGRLVTVDAQGRAMNTIALFDNQLGLPCEAQGYGADSLICVPVGSFEIGSPFYLDAACTNAVFVVAGSGCTPSLPEGTYMRRGTASVHRMIARVPSPASVFRRDGSLCVEQQLSAPVALYTVGEDIAPSLTVLEVVKE
jgi:hypothetical protein